MMTPVAALTALCLEEIRKARSGAIVEPFRKTRQTYFLVTYGQRDRGAGIDGLISRAPASMAQIEREASVFCGLTARPRKCPAIDLYRSGRNEHTTR